MIFNIFHQAVIRVAEKERAREAEKGKKQVGIEWSCMPGHSLPLKNVKNTFNLEAKTATLTMSLFEDDTTIIGMSGEIEEGKQISEKVMGSLKREPMNQRKRKWNSEKEAVRKSESVRNIYGK